MSQSITHIDLIHSGRCSPSAFIQAERDNAISELLECNVFTPAGDKNAPYHLVLMVKDQRLIVEIQSMKGGDLPTLVLSLRPYKRIIQDYFMMVESYNNARHLGADKLEAIDMGRRGIHNEGAEKLKERLASKVEIDFDTARRLFTLICVLHIGQVRGPRL